MKSMMKVIIAGAVIMVLGIAILCISLGVHGWKFDGDYEIITYECSDDNSTLDVEFSAGTLEINYYDGEKIKVEYPQNKVLSTEVEEADGALSFETKIKKSWDIISGFMKIPTAKIWIPQGDVINIKLELNAGSVKLARGEYCALDIKVNAGALSIGDVKCGKLSADVNAGSMNMQDVFSEAEVKLNLSAGSMDIKSLESPALVGDVSAGKASIGRIQTPLVDFDISAGSVRLAMAGEKSKYNVRIDKSAGSCNISDQAGSEDLRIKASISAGSLNVIFGAE